MRQFVIRTRLLLRLLGMSLALISLSTDFALAHAGHSHSDPGFIKLAADPIKEFTTFGRSAYTATGVGRNLVLSSRPFIAHYQSASGYLPCSVSSTDRIQLAFFFTNGSTFSPSTCNGDCCGSSSGCCKSFACGADCACCAGAALFSAQNARPIQTSPDSWCAAPPRAHLALSVAPELPPPRL